MNNEMRLAPSSIPVLACARKFELLRVQKRAPKNRELSARAATGIAWHGIMAELYNPLIGPCPPHIQRLQGACEKALEGLRLSVDEHQVVFNELYSATACYLDYSQTGTTVLGVELEDEYPFVAAGRYISTLEGRLDRLQVYNDQPDTLAIVDVSISQKRLTENQIWLSMALGKHLRPGYPRHAFELHVVYGGTVTIERYSGSFVKGTHRAIIAAVDAHVGLSEEGVYPATIGPACK